jgi:23S rRNA pseudouridine1911/1915/1917 synthase
LRPDLPLQRQALHAARLAFAHPLNDRPMDFIAPIPDDMASFWEACGGEPEEIDPQGW